MIQITNTRNLVPINKNDRTTTTCHVEPVTTARRISRVAVFVPTTAQLTYTFTSILKPNVNLYRKINELVKNYEELKSDGHFRTNTETTLRHISENWHYINECYPIHNVDRKTAETNKLIRRMLKSFLHYESRGMV